LSAPQTPYLYLGGLLLKGGEGRGEDGRGRERGEGEERRGNEGRGEKIRGGGQREFVLCPRKKEKEKSAPMLVTRQ